MRHLLARPKLGLIAAAVAALGATPTHSATVSWIGGTSFWDLVANWNSNPPALPGSADDVLIDVAGVQTVTYRSGTSTISSLTIAGDDLLAITGGSLTVANGFSSATTTTLSGGTLALNGSSSLAGL